MAADRDTCLDMSPAEFRQQGRAVIDWIADYLETIERRPVLAGVTPGAIRSALPAHPPETPEPFHAVLSDLDRVLMPGITHWQHPSFFAYFPANASGPAILGDLLSAGLGVQGMSWATSPAATELEQVVLDWLGELLGLPERFRRAGPGGGVIQDTASTAMLVAVLAALHRASDGATVRRGVSAGRYAVYCTSETHSAAEKAVRMAGLGTDLLRKVAVDDQQRMRPEALHTDIAADRGAGITPTLVVATVGTTSTGAIDPVEQIGPIASAAGAWLHVDAAWAGVAAICPELRWILDGVGGFADSVATNPHKWLLTNFDCDAMWVADREALLGALSILPEFLRTKAHEGGAVDYRDWTPQLGRRFRALKLWAVLRWYGACGLRRHIREHVALAQEFAERVAADGRFEIVAPHPLSLVCFRLRDDLTDDRTKALLEALNSSGRIYCSHTVVAGRFAIRFAIGGTRTTREHVERAWQQIAATTDRLGP